MNKEQDLMVLKKQLGRKARNIAKIPIRCSEGFPQVIATSPILDDSDSIFPTTFWLSCPELNYQIAKLEDRGFVTKIKDQIDDSPRLKSRLKQAHQDYANYRLVLLSNKQLKQLKEKNAGQYNVIKNSGVGGIMDFAGIKCLHTHYAHYLVDNNNPVGELVNQLLIQEFGSLNPVECKENCQLEG